MPQFGGQPFAGHLNQSLPVGRPKFYSYNEDMKSPLQMPTGFKVPTRTKDSIKEEIETSPSNIERSSLRQNRQTSYIEPNQRPYEDRQPRSARGTHLGETVANFFGQSSQKQQSPTRPFPESSSPLNKASQRSRSQMQTDPILSNIHPSFNRAATGGMRIDQQLSLASQPHSPIQKHLQIQELIQRQRSSKPDQSYVAATNSLSNEDKFKLQMYNASSTLSNPSEKSKYSSPGHFRHLQVESPEHLLFQQSSPSEQSAEVDSNIEAPRASASSYMSVSQSGSPRGFQKPAIWQPLPRSRANEPALPEQMRSQPQKPFAVQQTVAPFSMKPPGPPAIFSSLPVYSLAPNPMHIQNNSSLVMSTPDPRFESALPLHHQPYPQTDAVTKSYLRYAPVSQPITNQQPVSSPVPVYPAGVMVSRAVSPEEWRKDKWPSNNFSAQQMPPAPAPLLQKIDLTSQYMPPGFLHTRSDPIGDHAAPDRRAPISGNHQALL